MSRPLLAAVSAACLLWGAAGPGRAAEIDLPIQESSLYLESDRDAEKLLDAARKEVRARNWRKAVDLYQTAAAFVAKPAAGSDVPAQPLVSSPDDPAVVIPVQDAAALELARLPEEALEVYRQAYNTAAHGILEAALPDRDEARLSLVAHRYLATGQGGDALRMLGAIAFERGDYVGALAAWERLLAAHPGHGRTFLSVLAQMWVCYRALGRDAEAKALADELRQKHADARIDVGGQAVRLGDFLDKPVAVAAAGPLDDWPLLGGDATHARLPCGVEDVGDAVWALRVEGTAVTDAGRREFERRGLPIPYVLHPTVCDGRLLVAHDAAVYAHDAGTGRALWVFPDGPVASGGLRLDEAIHAPACADGRVFVRLEDGVAAFAADTGRLLWRHVFERRELKHKKKEKERGEREKRKGDEDEPELGSKELVFATPPVVAGGLVVFGHTALGEEARSSLVALDARDGQPVWRTFLCSRSVTGFLAMGVVGGPPAASGGTVCYSTNLGAVAAVEVPTGRVRWVHRYAAFRGRLRQSIIERTQRWANNPVLVHRGLVLAAPQDAPSLLAIDAVDGSLAWRVPRSGGRYLAGVEGDRLFVVGDQAVAFDLHTAKRLWATPIAGTLAGRPGLCPGRLFIPTEDRLLLAATDDGTVSTARAWEEGERPGNVAMAGGRLLVASCDRVAAFEDWGETRRRIEARRKAEPNDPFIPLAEGTHEADRGRHAEAIPLLEKALDLASKQPLAEDIARKARRRLFLSLRAIGAAASLAKAVACAPTPEEAAETQLALARLHEGQKRWAEAVAALQAIAERYPAMRLRTPGGLSVHGRALASAEIGWLTRDHGREVYAAVEARAREAFIAARSAQELEAIARQFPNSEGAEQALLKRLDMPDAQQTAPELTALAHSLAPDAASPARQLVAQTLEKWRQQAIAAHPPLARRWQVYTRVAQRRADHFDVPGLPPNLLYFATARRSYARALPFDGLECRAPDTGQLLWERELSEWDTLGVVAAGHLIIATFDQLVALDPSSGAFRWAYSLTDDVPLTAEALAPPAFRSPRRIEGRRITALVAGQDAVFAAVAGGKVFALAAADGQRRWMRELGRVDDAVFLLSRGLYPEADRLWVVAEHPASLFAVEQRDGSGGPTVPLSGPERRVTDLPAHDPDNGRLYLVLGDRSVHALDLRAGKELWRTTLEFGISRVLVGHQGKHCYVLPDSFAQDVQVVSLDPETGKIVRRRSLHTGALADAAVAEGVLYLAEKDTDNDLVIRALDPDDLGERWRTLPLQLFRPSSLAVSSDFVAITGRHQGQAVGILVNAANGKIAGDVKPPGVTQVAAALLGDLFCLGSDRGIHAYGPADPGQLDQRVAILGARHEGGDRSALGPLASALYQRGDEERAVELLAKALTDETLTDDQYATLKDQLNSIREALVAERPPTLIARRFETAPNINGAIDDPWRADQAAYLTGPEHIEEIQGRSVRESRWTSPSDLSAILYLGWDEKHLYFAIDVNDDIHRTYTSQRDTWAGDGLIISIDCDNDGGFGYAFTGRDLLLTLALTRKDERKDEQEDEDDTPKGAYRVRRKDDNSGTIYECAIPWDYMKMAPPKPGQRLGFNVTITDDDGDRATKAVSWTPSMILDRDRDLMIRGFTPAWFGDVLLEDAGAPPKLLEPPAVLQPEPTDNRKR